MARELWNHQKIAISRAVSLDEYALFFDPGTGKTLTCITILRHKYAAEKKVLKTLIFCPPIVVDNWKREFAEGSKIPAKDIITLKGPGRDRVKHMMANLGDKIFITNYESLLMTDLFNLFVHWCPDVLVLDESHKCKDIKSKRTKLLFKLSPLARYRYILTGTPVLNSALDLFSQFKILDGGKTFGMNYVAFRAKYFYDRNAGMPGHKHFADWAPIPGSMDNIHKLMEPRSMHVKKSECLDLPPLLIQNFYIDLSSEQKRTYDAMHKDFITYMADKTCVATIALTKGLRLMQIVSGFLTVGGDDGTVRENISFRENPRAEALSELLAEITPHSKVLVWAVFKENYEAIRNVCNALGVNFVEVHGDVPEKKKQENVKAFNEDPKIRVFIGHPASSGIGINLCAASYSIFYSRNFSLEQDLQAEARNYRGGSEVHEKIIRINLIAKGTIDEVVTESLGNKVKIGDDILKKIALEGK